MKRQNIILIITAIVLLFLISRKSSRREGFISHRTFAPTDKNKLLKASESSSIVCHSVETFNLSKYFTDAFKITTLSGKPVYSWQSIGQKKTFSFITQGVYSDGRRDISDELWPGVAVGVFEDVPTNYNSFPDFRKYSTFLWHLLYKSDSTPQSWSSVNMSSPIFADPEEYNNKCLNSSGSSTFGLSCPGCAVTITGGNCLTTGYIPSIKNNSCVFKFDFVVEWYPTMNNWVMTTTVTDIDNGTQLLNKKEAIEVCIPDGSKPSFDFGMKAKYWGVSLGNSTELNTNYNYKIINISYS